MTLFVLFVDLNFVCYFMCVCVFLPLFTLVYDCGLHCTTSFGCFFNFTS